MTREFQGHHCTTKYHGASEDRGSYAFAWTMDPNNTQNSGRNLAYKYLPETSPFFFFGHFGIYPSGGYSLNLGNTRTSAYDAVLQAKEGDWLDGNTRAVLVEFNVLVPNLNLFTAVKIALEFSNIGNVVATLDFSTLRLYSYVGAKAILLLMAQIILVLIIIYITVREVRSMIKIHLKYFYDPWNILDIFGLVVAYTAVALFIQKQFNIVSSVENVVNHPGKTI